MAGNAKALREGQHSITAHLVVSGAAKALDFYKDAFNAEIEVIRKVVRPSHMESEG